MRANFFAQGIRASGSGRTVFSQSARRGAIVGLLSILLALACQRRSDFDSPEQAVRALVDRMQRIHGDPERSLAAFEMLSKTTQDNLRERAQRASAAAGRVVRPEEMIAPSRFFLDFPVVRWSTRRGSDWAIVKVEGDGPDMQREIRCRLENGEWRVVIRLPELPPLKRRKR